MMFSSIGLSKVEIRQKVWNHFQENDLANFPLSVYRRIPNFKVCFINYNYTITCEFSAPFKNIKYIDIFFKGNK